MMRIVAFSQHSLPANYLHFNILYSFWQGNCFKLLKGHTALLLSKNITP
jgi:hypothetical protein